MSWSLYHFAFIITGFTLTWLLLRRKTRLPYPPGPPAEPFIGHMRILPATGQEVVFREWSRTYGDIMYLYIPGRSYVVLNSLKAANEILEKRSGIYSDRMRLILYELMGWYPTLTFLHYGKRFQKHRRLVQDYLLKKRCVSYEPLQTKYTRQLLVNLLDNPQHWVKHLSRFSASVITVISYGKEMAKDDTYMDIATSALESLSSCGSVGSTPVDFLPFLAYLPSWFPGTYYAYKARSFRFAVRKMHEYPFEAVKRQMTEGTAQPSYLSHSLDQLHGKDLDQEHMEDLQGTATTMFAGGTDTTHAALSFFMLAMVLFPECQKKAQKEIDEVIGKDRFPELRDRESLPYVEALMYEILRWNTVVPSGVPHRSIEDDVYNGMFIPKGTVVVANIFAILRDESIYSDPDNFNPSRYLPKPEGKAEPYPIGHFGFGRRVCPGRYFAEASVWTVMTSVLATLDIGRALDDNGKEIVPGIDLCIGLISHPNHFPCTIKPRDKRSENMVRQAQLWNDA